MSEIKTYLSKKGYVLIKKYFTREEIDKVKNQLKAKIISDGPFNNIVNTFPIYIETENNLYIPKMYGFKYFNSPDKYLKNYFGLPFKNNISFNGTLFDSQITAVNHIIDVLKKKSGAILHLTAGSGKTVCAINIISKLQTKTVIVVNKISLLKQWQNEINYFLPNINIGIVQGSKNIDIQNKDILLVMLQSLATIDYPDSFFNDIGFVIFDECHNIGSKIFSKILFKLTSQYTLGLSATPNRSDNCEHVFKYHIGDIEYSAQIERKGLSPHIHLIKLLSSEYKEESKEYNINGISKSVIQFTSMISNLIDINSRNILIKNTLIELMSTKIKRKILVLSDRRNHLYTIFKMLNEYLLVYPNLFTVGLFLGSMKLEELEKTKKCNIILATYQSFSEGVSEKDLDTLFLISPKKFQREHSNKKDSGKMEQIVGRIFRKHHTLFNPLILDLQDHFSVYKSHSSSRLFFYKEHFKNISPVFIKHSINLDNNTSTAAGSTLFNQLSECKSNKDNQSEDESNENKYDENENNIYLIDEN